LRPKFDYENHSCLNYALQFNQTKLVPRRIADLMKIRLNFGDGKSTV
jgi:hypothetical protein